MATINNYSKAFCQKHGHIVACLLLVITILAVYGQVAHYGFVNYDDDYYVYGNRQVQDGLTYKGIVWAFTASHAANWHPLTWLSHMLDCQLYGLDAGRHHVTNLLFHIANSLLLFVVFRKMTGSLGPSGLVAVLFAIHPLHVESVAWIAERKDVLSTFFWFLTMWCYIRWVKYTGIGLYLTALMFFGLGLLAKPMLVTLPFVLLLLDYWPLHRLGHAKSSFSDQDNKTFNALRLVYEKTPFFVMAAISSVVTLWAQQQGGTVVSLDILPFKERILNALVAYVSYILKLLWPARLAVFYPHPGMVSLWQVAGACLLLASLSLLAIKAIKKRPYFIVGWLWYLGTLVPVIGLVQVGRQAMADRYAYIPLIGLFVIVAWGLAELWEKWPQRKLGFAVLAVSLVSILMTATWKQVRCWENSTRLFEHAIQVTDNNYIAHNHLGVDLKNQGQPAKAMEHFLKALQVQPNYTIAHYNLGNALASQGRPAEAIEHYRAALRLNPDLIEAHNSLGLALERRGRPAEAVEHYSAALQIKPDFVNARYNLGNALAGQGRLAEAAAHYLDALRIQPDFAEAHYNLGNVLESQGRLKKAVEHYLKALQLKPDFAKAHNNLGLALEKQRRIDEAIGHYGAALQIQPDFVNARYNLGNALSKQGRLAEAIEHYQAALRIEPDHVDVHNNLGTVLFRKQDIAGAIRHFKAALSLQPDYVHARNNLKKALIIQRQNRREYRQP